MPCGLGQKCYTNSVHFDWDPAKAARNLRKHRVAFAEAATVFRDPLALFVQDEEHRDRLVLFGSSERLRVLVVVHAEVDDDTIRIISARLATAHERRRYEEGE